MRKAALLLLIASPCAAGQIAADRYPGLVMLYHFNENSGTVVKNSYRAGASTDVYNGTLQGGAYFNGNSKLGSSVFFHGTMASGDWIELDWSRAIEMTTFTAIAMLKWDASGSSTQQGIWHVDQTGTGIGLSLESGFEPTIHVGGDYYHVMGPILVANRWTVISGSWYWGGGATQTKGIVEGYRDGIFISSKAVSTLPSFLSPFVNRIGTRSDTPNSFYFAGFIDEFAVFNRRLTAGEQKEIANELLGRKHGASEQ